MIFNFEIEYKITRILSFQPDSSNRSVLPNCSKLMPHEDNEGLRGYKLDQILVLLRVDDIMIR